MGTGAEASERQSTRSASPSSRLPIGALLLANCISLGLILSAIGNARHFYFVQTLGDLDDDLTTLLVLLTMLIGLEMTRRGIVTLMRGAADAYLINRIRRGGTWWLFGVWVLAVRESFMAQMPLYYFGSITALVALLVLLIESSRALGLASGPAPASVYRGSQGASPELTVDS